MEINIGNGGCDEGSLRKVGPRCDNVFRDREPATGYVQDARR